MIQVSDVQCEKITNEGIWITNTQDQSQLLRVDNMGPDNRSGIVIQWNEVSATGVIKDDSRDELVYFGFANYALSRYSTNDFLFTPQVSESVDYVLFYYDKPTACGITNKKYWAYWHHINKVNLEAERSRKRLMVSVVVNITLTVIVIPLLWLLKVLIFS